MPVSDLRKKGKTDIVVWTESHQKPFDTLNNMLSARLILKFSDFQETFILRKDATDDGLGAILLQTEDGEKLPVANANRKVQQIEITYMCTLGLCLAVVLGIEIFINFGSGKRTFQTYALCFASSAIPLSYHCKKRSSNIDYLSRQRVLPIIPRINSTDQ